jgi:hypothetical protein
MPHEKRFNLVTSGLPSLRLFEHFSVSYFHCRDS